MPEVVLRIAGDNVSAIRSVKEFLSGLQDVRVEEGRVAEASKTAGISIAEQARLNVTKAIEQRDALRGLIQEYSTVGQAAAAGSEEARVASQLWMESNAKLAATYDAVGASAKRASAEAVASSAKAREESGLARGFASRTFGLSAFAGGAFIAGAAAGLIVKKATDEATRAQESQAQLQNALQRTGQSWDKQGESIDRYLEKAERASAFDKIDLRTSLGQLVRATGDTAKAQDLLSQATDVARGRHISLDTAVRLVTRAYQGSIGSLSRIGIHVDAVTTATDKLRAANVKVTPEMAKQAKELDRQATATHALQVLNDRYSGSAESHARTLAGRQEALKNAFTDVSVAIGQAVTPALTRMFDWMTRTVQSALHSKRVHDDLHQTLHILGSIIKAVVADLRVSYDIYEKVAGVVGNQLIPALVILTGIAGVKLVNSWKAARAEAIKSAEAQIIAAREAAAAQLAGDAEVEAANVSLLATMPWMAIAATVLIAVTEIIQHWSTVKRWMGDLWRYLKEGFAAAWDVIKGVAYGAVYAILQYATAAIRGILTLASHLPFVGDKAKAALDSINGYLDHWKRKSMGEFAAAGQELGQSWGDAYVAAATKSMQNLKPGTVITGQRGGPHGQAEGVQVVSGHASGVQGALVQTGLTAIGNPYQYGGNPSLSSPTDCSGLMVAIFAKHGIKLPRRSEDQYGLAPIKNAKPLAVGDLVFSEGVHPNHVGLYIGKQQVLEDPHTGDHVKIVPLSGFGWNGESARWWGGHRRGGGGGGGGAASAPATPSVSQIIAEGKPNAPAAAPAYHGPTGDELLPVALMRRARRFAAAAASDIAAAGSSTGIDVADFYEKAAEELRREEQILRQEVRTLDRKLKGAHGGRKKAIEAEIAKVEGQIASVHKAVTSAIGQEENALQSVVSTLQSTVSTAFSSISQAIVAKFEANTQELVDRVGKQFFQGALTPEEQRYQAAQASDQVQSLQDALVQAQASGDPTQIAAAKHAIDMYNLEAAAAASRAKADADYAAAVAKIQKEREDEEEHLTVALDAFGTGLQDGSNSMADLQPLLDKYGVRVSDLADSSFIFKTNLDSLSDSVKELDRALVDLADLVSQITGKPVHHPRHHHHQGASGGGGSTGGGGGPSTPAPPVPAFAGGGIVEGPMIGPEDTITARVSTGEGVVSRDLMRHLLLAATGGGQRLPAHPVRSAPIIVLGATEHQVGLALERIVTPAQARRAGFQNYP